MKTQDGSCGNQPGIKQLKRWKETDTDSISVEQEEEVGRVTSVGKEERPKKPSQSNQTLF